MRSTDQMLSRLVAEIEEKQVFIDGVVEDAEKQGRDLNSQEMELATRARTRVGELQPQLDQLLELRRMGSESRAKLAELAPFMREQPGPAKEIEYRTAGEYVLDQWRSGLGDSDASGRLEIYNRAASHQTTANSPGLIPTPIVGPVVDFIDASRPLVNALGPRQLPGQNWSRPKVTVHTTVGAQSAEKAELTSQAMTITKLSGVAVTYGGYVNVSRQAVDFTQPGVMDIVIQDLAGQYAIQTETAAATAFAAAATAGTTLPTGANTADQVAGALWAAAAAIYAGTKGIGKVFAVVPPGLLGAWGSLFAPYGPMNQFGTGILGGGLHDRPRRCDRRHPRLRVDRDRGEHRPGALHGRGRGVRGADRLAAGRRAQRARHPGRLCGLLHADGDRADRHHQDHEDAVMPAANITTGDLNADDKEAADKEAKDSGGTIWDAPNQQVVREDESPPWEQGAGGGGNPDPQKKARKTDDDDDADSGSGSELEQMTKAEVLDRARTLGVTPANNDMTKAELIAAVEAHS